MGGVNLYNFIWIVPDVRFDLLASAIPNIFLAISVILLLLHFGKKGPMLEAILAFMFAYFLFGHVLNEQFLVAILPLMLLCKKCDYRIWVAPFAFIFLRSPFYYFALPILWASPVFYQYYFLADNVWMWLQTEGYLMIPMYAVGVAFSLLLFLNLQRVIESTPRSLNIIALLQKLNPRSGFHSVKSSALSRKVRILLR